MQNENLVADGRRGVGNTSRRSTPRVYWFLTWNNPQPHDFDDLVGWFRKNALRWVVQEERGESGTLHLQGCFKLKGQGKRFETLQKEFRGVHFETCKSERAEKYCAKETFEGARQSIYPEPVRVYRPTHEIFNKLEELMKVVPDHRSILWFIDKEGGVGKSAFSKYMKVTYEDQVTVITSSKSADILTCVSGNERMIIFDFPRCSNIGTYCPFNAIEQIKNGFVTDCKLKKQGRTLIFNAPHVVVFANEEPDRYKLSPDKWKIEYFK